MALLAAQVKTTLIGVGSIRDLLEFIQESLHSTPTITIVKKADWPSKRNTSYLIDVDVVKREDEEKNNHRFVKSKRAS
jgi:hypothetical protein